MVDEILEKVEKYIESIDITEIIEELERMGVKNDLQWKTV